MSLIASILTGFLQSGVISIVSRLMQGWFETFTSNHVFVLIIVAIVGFI